VDTLAAIKQSTYKELKKKFDLVWYARFRYRYSNHEASSRIDKGYKEEIPELRSDEGDFHHSFNSGVLAASPMFASQADVLHIKDLVRTNVSERNLFCREVKAHTGMHPPFFSHSLSRGQGLIPKLMEEAVKHQKKIDDANESFPQLKWITTFPSLPEAILHVVFYTTIGHCVAVILDTILPS
jgi:GNAT superfamily N-acetyltransferase